MAKADELVDAISSRRARVSLLSSSPVSRWPRCWRAPPPTAGPPSKGAGDGDGYNGGVGVGDGDVGGNGVSDDDDDDDSGDDIDGADSDDVGSLAATPSAWAAEARSRATPPWSGCGRAPSR